MRPFAALERLLERLFERPGARLFDVGVAPATLARRIERAIDQERRPGAEGTVAPTRFVVSVDARAAVELGDMPNLENELAAAALAHARRRGYLIPERPSVAIVASTDLDRGATTVRATFAGPFPLADTAGPASERTRVHPVAVQAAPSGVLRVIGPDGMERRVRLEARPIGIGRGDDNDVVMADPLLSRHHARIVPRNGRLVLTDLASRNGTRVNGRAVKEAVLGAGDRVELGGTTIDILPPDASWTP
jgi:Protein of unknown function (DUF3662)/FHA domain